VRRLRLRRLALVAQLDELGVLLLGHEGLLLAALPFHVHGGVADRGPPGPGQPGGPQGCFG
jgi:hypothetical protein